MSCGEKVCKITAFFAHMQIILYLCIQIMSRQVMIVLIIVSLLCLTVVMAVLFFHPAFGPHPFGGGKEPESKNYREGRFQNEIPTPQFTGERTSGLAAMWKFLTDRSNERSPKTSVETVRTDIKSLPADKDWFVWFGHSSYLFSIGGNKVLVDPLLKMEFPASVMMKPFPGTDIYTPEDMPEIDLLVITHEHWDHMDYATLRELRPKIRHIVCPLGIAQYMTYWGFPREIITEMDWYDEGERVNGQTAKVRVTCLPTRHFSNRLFGANQTLWASFMVECNGRKVYIGGDGGYDDRFSRIRDRFGAVDLAVMENGQYNTNWAYIHMLPKDLEQAMLDLQAQQYITVHHDKFSLAPHAWSEPDSVAHSIAERDGLQVLDQPIGSVIYW